MLSEDNKLNQSADEYPVEKGMGNALPAQDVERALEAAGSADKLNQSADEYPVEKDMGNALPAQDVERALEAAGGADKIGAAASDKQNGEAEDREANQSELTEADLEILRSIKELESELKEMDRREAGMEDQLQLYSDVIGLRKELAVVRKDESRVRRQCEMDAEELDRHCPQIEETVQALEEEAQKSPLQHIWTSVCEQDPAIVDEDTSRWLKIDTENMTESLRKSKERLADANKELKRLQRAQEEKINSNTDERERMKRQMEESLKNEIDNLVQTRTRLKQLDRDQAFHIKRGTYIKEHQVSKQKRLDMEHGRIYRNEYREFASKCSLEKEIVELTEQVKQSKRILEDNRRSNTEIMDKLKVRLREAEEGGKEAHELRMILEKEGEDMKSLKQDLTRVLHYVRTRNYHMHDD